MTRWDALRVALDAVSGSFFRNGSKPLTPNWLRSLMYLAERAEEKGWDENRIMEELVYDV